MDLREACNINSSLFSLFVYITVFSLQVSFGSLIGFLPYRNLAAKWKFLAFESWLRRNGLDPSKYRQHLGIIGNDEVPNKSSSFEPSPVPDDSQKEKLELSADMELEDLLKIYDEEKIRYLSSYIGQV